MSPDARKPRGGEDAEQEAFISLHEGHRFRREARLATFLYPSQPMRL